MSEDIVELLRAYVGDDHERGCQGRYYDCSCGYDDKRDPLLTQAADEIERLRGGMLKMASAMSTQVETIEKLRAALRDIAKTTYGYEPYMTDEEAKNYFSSQFFGAQAKARAALEEK